MEENFSESKISDAELAELCGGLEDEEEPEEDYEKYFDELESLPNLEEDSYYDTEAIYVADVETATNGKHHVEYMICWDRLNGTDKGGIKGRNCCRKFINHLKKQKEKKITVMFQNFAYDANFVIKHLARVMSSIEPSKNKNYRTDGIIFSDTGQIKKISFVDQLPKMPMALSKYEKMFNLEKGKFKNFPHWFYNLQTVFLNVVTADRSLYSRLAEIFPKQYLDYSEDGTKVIVKHMDYAFDYCHQDVKTQRDGYNIMWQQVMDETGLDYNKILTLSGLAKAVRLKEGCYEGVHEIRGKTGAFIRQCVVGGRVMPALHDKKNPGIHILNEEEGEEYQNGFDYNYPDDQIESEEKHGDFIFRKDGDVNIFLSEKTTKKEPVKIKKPKSKPSTKFISPRPRIKRGNKKLRYICLDANSLYPTAITQLKGFPKGAPKNISKKDLDSKHFQQIADEYFVKIKILAVGVKYNFPLLNYVSDDGERIWSNDLVGRTMYVDRIMLEGLVKYHEIKYVCKAGVMFNEGYNTKVVDVVKKFYSLRLKYKAENNPVELLYKLILNNIYGKNIEKPKEHKMIWNTGDAAELDEIHRKYGACKPIISRIRNKMFKIKVKLGFDAKHWSTP